jgi:para-nitrobenzyl esterase
MKQNKINLAIAAVMFFAISCTRVQLLDPSVQTKYGTVLGVINDNKTVVTFKGIPYAAPPVGDLRWREPQAPPSWEGVRDGSKFCASCMQKRAFNWLPERPYPEEFLVQDSISEDCLYLNIWTPAKTASDNLAVFVYIHGGGYTEGSGSIAVYDGEELAKKGIIVITINYRLGVLGFLAHPDLTAESPNHVSGNYGLLDQIAALKWIRENISAFGGDPNRITICGQSAGSSAVNSLVASPLAKGLFQRAITQSGSSYVRRGGPGIVNDLAEAEKTGIDFAKRKGASSLTELRSITASEIIAEDNIQPVLSFRETIEGYFLEDNVVNTIASGKQNDTPFMTGMDRDELNYNGEKSKAFFALYPLGQDGDTAKAVKIAGQEQSRLNAFLFMENRAKTAKTHGYIYYFDQAIPWPEYPQFGAYHTSEVVYIFRNFKKLDRPWTAVDTMVSEMLSSYWVNFINTGDPNESGLPEWRVFDPNDRSVMRLGENMGMIPVAVSEERYNFVKDQLLKNQQ